MFCRYAQEGFLLSSHIDSCKATSNSLLIKFSKAYLRDAAVDAGGLLQLELLDASPDVQQPHDAPSFSAFVATLEQSVAQ